MMFNCESRKMINGYCKVRNCNQFSNNDYKSVYHIPKLNTRKPITPNQELRLRQRQAWLKALGFKDYNSHDVDDLVVCPKHFVFGKPAALTDVDNIDWVPTLQLGQSDCSNSEESDVVDLTEDSYAKEHGSANECVKRRNATDLEDDKNMNQELPSVSAVNNVQKRKLPPLKPSPQVVQRLRRIKDADVNHLSGQNINVNFTDSQEQLGFTDEYKELEEINSVEDIRKLKAENKQLLSQNLSLKAKLLETEALYKSLETDHRISMSKFSDLRYSIDRYTINEKTFISDEEKVKYFTGLPTFDVLKAMFTHIEPFMETTQYPITKFQQYILTLMGIRLNIGFDLLGYVFRLPVQIVSKIFSRVLQVMYARYKPLVSWPSRANLFPRMPLLFRETFGQQIVIIVVTLHLSVVIDSIEVMLDGPSGNDPSPSTVVSDYRNHTIVKFLIGMTPQGAVTFLSKGFTEILSEKELIETSGLLINLLAGDIIMGGKDCSVYEVVQKNRDAAVGRSLNSANSNSLCLQPYELKIDHNFINLTNHVEQVSDSFKKSFNFWSSGLPVEFFSVTQTGQPAVDKMIQTCCALNNAKLTVVM